MPIAPENRARYPSTLRADADECDALRAKLADTLTRTAEALRGPPEPLTAWSWHDLPEIAAGMRAEVQRLTEQRDMARAEWAAACKCLSAANAEVERLRSGEPLSLLSAIIAELDDEPPHGPGHSHSKAGVWDCDNQPALAGKPCDWCATWDKARTLVAEATKEQQENAS